MCTFDVVVMILGDTYLYGNACRKTEILPSNSHRCNYSGHRVLLLFIVSYGRIGRTLLKKRVAVGIADT